MATPTTASLPLAPWEQPTPGGEGVPPITARPLFLTGQGPVRRAHVVPRSPTPNVPLRAAAGALLAFPVWPLFGQPGFLVLFFLLVAGGLLGALTADPVIRPPYPRPETDVERDERRRLLLQRFQGSALDTRRLEAAVLEHLVLPALRDGRLPPVEGPWSLDALWIPHAVLAGDADTTAVVSLELALCQIVPVQEGADRHSLLPKGKVFAFPLPHLSPGITAGWWNEAVHDHMAFRIRQTPFAAVASAHARLSLLSSLQARHQALRSAFGK